MVMVVGDLLLLFLLLRPPPRILDPRGTARLRSTPFPGHNFLSFIYYYLSFISFYYYSSHAQIFP